MPRSSTIFAYYSSLEIHRVSTNRKNPELPKSNLTPSRGEIPHIVHSYTQYSDVNQWSGERQKRSFDFIECCKHEKIDKLENFHNLPEIDFTPRHTNLFLDSSLFIPSLLSVFFLSINLLFVCGTLHYSFKVHWISRGIEIFIYAGLNSRIFHEDSSRAPSNTVDHAHTRVRSHEIKACICNPGLYHGYTCRSDLHIISKSVNTGHGSDFHSRMALSRIRCLCRYHIRGSWLEETVNENGTERGDSIPSLNLWEIPEKDAAFYEAVGWHK